MLLDGLPVLIVDDNATNRLILSEIMTSWLPARSPLRVDRRRWKPAVRGEREANRSPSL